MNKPRLGFWQIWNMSFGFLGIQFGWGLQMANISPIYAKLGANPDELTHTPEGFAPAGEPSRLVPWTRVAQAAYAGSLPPGEEPGLEATSYFRLADEPWSFGACTLSIISFITTPRLPLPCMRQTMRTTMVVHLSAECICGLGR